MNTDRQTSLSSDLHTSPVLRQFEWTGSESVSAAVIQAVAIFSDKAPTELPSFNDAVDPDALNAIVNDSISTSKRGRVEITFLFNNHLVKITSTGEGYICPKGSAGGA